MRTALGANPGQLLCDVLAHAAALLASGVAAGGALVLLFVAAGGGPSGRTADDVPLFGAYLAITGAVVLAAGVLASLAPARRALRINPMEALRDM